MRPETTDHEEFCRLNFDAWLERGGADSHRRWEKGSDPPDFVLTMGNVRYSVEISRIIDEDRITASVSLSRLIDGLEQDLLATSAIAGTYVVDPAEPLPKGARHRRELRGRVAAFIERTKDEIRTLPDDIEMSGRRIVRIEKHSSEGAHLICNGIGGGGWEDEIRQEYERIAGDLLRRKKTCLEKHGPSVLVLQDALCPISPRILRGVIWSIPEASAFEAIYVIRAESAGDIVWSRSNWPLNLRTGIACEVIP